ncbi:MAG: hypothetical protein EA349_06340 [Halomonadaceae bacterium]|nr:MAG: hypothetical protein EA349_06340 [Halomonadaceae bacterium]
MLMTLLSGTGVGHWACSLFTASLLPICYNPSEGAVPQVLHPPEQKLWTNKQVDQAVVVDYITIPGGEPLNHPNAPAACDQVSFLRFRHQQGPVDAEQADAAFLMVPGVLEGANGFEFIGRQLVWMAWEEHHKAVEVWAMDRRANCLEDLTGAHAAGAAETAQEAEDLLLGYYYEGMQINGQQFAGYLNSSQMPYLVDFGLRQSTLDIKAIIDHMMPTPGLSKEKLFLGGHSLGGIHTSVFLGWNFAEDPDNTGAAGYNQVAGAFGLESQVVPLDSGAFFSAVEDTQTGMIDSNSRKLLNGTSSLYSAQGDWNYRFNLWLLESNLIPRSIHIPGLFSPEVIAVPEFLGIVASKAPDQEATLYRRLPPSRELDNIVDLVHSTSPATIGKPPLLGDFRYTNQAYVGIMFDKNFQLLSFLKTGLGFMEGGPMKRKWRNLTQLAEWEQTADLVQNLSGRDKLFIASDAGADRDHFGTGPLYGWASRDRIATPEAPTLTDARGSVNFTHLEDEPVAMDDFIRALHTGPTNLTEWYFPLRILLDLGAVGQPYAPRHGLMTYHIDGANRVPSLVINGSRGIDLNDPAPEKMPKQVRLVAPGYSHMDPLFEAVNSPSQPGYVMRPLLDFAFTVQSALKP